MSGVYFAERLRQAWVFDSLKRCTRRLDLYLTCSWTSLASYVHVGLAAASTGGHMGRMAGSGGLRASLGEGVLAVCVGHVCRRL